MSEALFPKFIPYLNTQSVTEIVEVQQDAHVYDWQSFQRKMEAQSVILSCALHPRPKLADVPDRGGHYHFDTLLQWDRTGERRRDE